MPRTIKVGRTVAGPQALSVPHAGQQAPAAQPVQAANLPPVPASMSVSDFLQMLQNRPDLVAAAEQALAPGLFSISIWEPDSGKNKGKQVHNIQCSIPNKRPFRKGPEVWLYLAQHVDELIDFVNSQEFADARAHNAKLGVNDD